MEEYVERKGKESEGCTSGLEEGSSVIGERRGENSTYLVKQADWYMKKYVCIKQ